MDFDCQSYDNQNFLVTTGLVTEKFGHHMLGNQNSSIAIFSMCHCGLTILQYSIFSMPLWL
jgi:hypothetical protein